MNRREFLKQLGAAAIVAVIPKVVVANNNEPVEEEIEWIEGIQIDGWWYTHDPICPECILPADKCWCVSERVYTDWAKMYPDVFEDAHDINPAMVGTSWDHGSDLEWTMLYGEEPRVVVVGPPGEGVAVSDDWGATWVVYEKEA